MKLQKLFILSLAVLLPLAVLLIWLLPTSKDFVVRTLLIGSFWALLFRSSNHSRSNLLAVFIPILVLVVGGFYWSRDHAFGTTYKIASVRLWLDFMINALTAFVATNLTMAGRRSTKNANF